MELEDEMLGEVRLVSPDDPANTGVDQTEFVARGVDRLYTGKLEVPCDSQLGVRPLRIFKQTIWAHQLWRR